MAKNFGLPALLGSNVLSLAIGAIGVFIFSQTDIKINPINFASTEDANNLKNVPKAYEDISDENLRSQLKKSSIELKSEVLDTGEIAIGQTLSKHAYIVTEPNQYQSNKRVHYTKWKYGVTKDELRNTTTRYATVGNTAEFTGNMREPLAFALNIACKDSDNVCQMWISSDFTFDPSWTGMINLAKFSIKIDDKELKDYELNLDNTHMNASARSDLMNDLYNNISDIKRVRAEFSSGNTGQVEFNVSGFDRAVFNSQTYEEITNKLKK